MFVEHLEELKTDLNGLRVLNVHEVTEAVLDLPTDLQLAHAGLAGTSHLEFDSTFSSAEVHGIYGGNLRGNTIFVQRFTHHIPVVFLGNDTLHGHDYDSAETLREVRAGFMTIALAHELGHCDDFRNLTNFSLDPTRVDLIKAEIYAHCYALNLLHERNWDEGRDTLASALRKLPNLGKIPKQVYAGVCRGIGRGRLRKWAKE